MKTLKKALSIILGLAIMLSCVAGMQVSVAAEGTVALSVGEATVADGVVTVPVVVDANAGFQSLAVTVSYDDAVLDLVSAEKNAKFGAADDVAAFGPYDANPFKMMWAYAYSTENVTATGTIATLTFNLVDETAETADITLAVTEAWDVAGNEVAATTAEKETVDLVTGPTVDPSLVVAGASVGYGVSSLQIGFRVRKTVIQKYDSMQLVIIPQKYDTTSFNLVDPEEIVVPLAVGGTFTTYNYTDIYLYELGLNIDYLLRAYDAEGNLVAVSETFTTSAASYLKTQYAASTDSKFRTLVADTLVVGAEAAKNFGKEGSDLANAPSILEGFDTSEASATYGNLNTVNTHDAIDAAWGTASTCAHQSRISVSIGKVPYFTYRVKGGSSLDINKLSFTVSYTQATGAGGATAPYSKTFTAADGSVYKSGSFIMFKFDQIGLLDGDKDISIVANYDGANVFNATYSIQTYLGANTTSTIGDFAVALIKLGASAGIYMA